MLRPTQSDQVTNDFEKSPPEKGKVLAITPGATVYLKEIIEGKPIVVKQFEKDKSFERESDIALRLITHPHIIQYYGHNAPHKTILMEWVPKGDLNNYVDALNKNNLPKHYPATRIKYSLGLAKALSFLKSQRILHRDIKLPNALITEEDEIKLCDFGFAYQLKADEDKVEHDCAMGTPFYLAPEIIPNDMSKKPRYSFASDLWAFYIALWRMYSLLYPYEQCRNITGKGYNLSLLCRHLSAGNSPEIDQITDEPVRKLALQIWNPSPKERPDIDEVIPVLEQVYKTYQPGTSV